MDKQPMNIGRTDRKKSYNSSADTSEALFI